MAGIYPGCSALIFPPFFHPDFFVAHEKFAEYNGEIQKQKGTPYLSAEEYGQLMKEAGFVDLQVIYKLCDHGTYTQGMYAH
jgi:hypothetical protein